MNLGYRKGVGVFLLNKNKHVWVGKRLDVKNNFWQMPQGGIDSGENAKEAMMRELLEEIGTNNIKIIGTSKEWLSYNIPKELVKKIWKGRYLGQSQKWFACRFVGKENEINLNTRNPEFTDWKWIKPQLLMKSVIPFKRELYKKILEIFKDLYN